MLLRSLVIVLGLCAVGRSHDWETGRCPKHALPMKDFDISRFAGDWYVREKTDTGSSCLKNTYYQRDGNWHLLETRDWFVLDSVGLDSNIGHDAILTLGTVHPGDMKAKFQLNIAGNMDHVILDTDYENYAVLYECQDVMNFLGLFQIHRRSGSILTRNADWNESAVFQRLRSEVERLGLDPLDTVSHQGCADPNIKLTFDEKFVGTVNKALDGALDSVGDAFDSAVSHVSEAIDGVASFSRDALKPDVKEADVKPDPDFPAFDQVFKDLQDVEIIVPGANGQDIKVTYEKTDPAENEVIKKRK